VSRPLVLAETELASTLALEIRTVAVNVLWRLFNAVIGYLLVARVGDFHPRSSTHIVAFGLGVLLISVTLARHLGQFH
jgi:hypothetical protein